MTMIMEERSIHEKISIHLFYTKNIGYNFILEFYILNLYLEF